MMNKSAPSVGIGLPVYNNAEHISKTLDSILTQTYENITVYISDDCSNDGTDRICELFAKRDFRIKYLRNQRNVGANENHAKVLSLASTQYFMFARGHEILSRNLVRDCLQVLEDDKEVVLAFATTKWINEEDKVIAEKPIGYFDTRGFDVATRAALVLWGNLEPFYGLTSTKVIKSIRALEEIIASGVIMLLEMALVGTFAHVNDSFRYRRYRYSNETYRKRIRRYTRNTYHKLNLIDGVSPFARLPYNLFLSIERANISAADKVKVLLVVLLNAPVRYIVSRGKQL